MSETCEVIIHFDKFPTWKQACKAGIPKQLSFFEWFLWGLGLITSGKHYHVWFEHAGVPYHYTTLSTAEMRRRFNDEAATEAQSFRIRVTRENVAKATLYLDAANANKRRCMVANCTHACSVLIYGHPNRYCSWFGIGWWTRRCLKDIQLIQAGQR